MYVKHQTMKRIFTLFFILGSLSILFFSNSNGTFTADYTGSANLSTQHCAQSGCHTSGGFSGDGTIEIKVLSGTTPVMSYTPGAVYTIQIKRPVSVTKVGMQSGTMLWASSTPIGSIANNFNPTHLQINNVTGGTMISHTTLGSTAAISAGFATYKYTWTAPPTDVGAIDVYAVMNISNNNGSETGDSVVRNIFTLQKPSSVLDQGNNKLELTLYPSPAENSLSFNSKSHEPLSTEVKIFSLSGQLVQHVSNINNLNTYQLDITALPSSVYYCLVKQGKYYGGSMFVKK